jgi:hypothetical protein
MRASLLLIVLVGCGGDDVFPLDAPHVDAGSASPLLNGATGAPADYSCNGSFTLGSADAVSAHTVHVASLKFPNTDGARIDLIDPTTAQPTGTFALADMTTSDAQLDEPGNSLVAWHVSMGNSCPDTCVESYMFAQRTLSAAAAAGSGVEHALLFDIDDYVGREGHAGVTGNADHGEIVGTVVDCTGAPVENAHVAFPACSDGSDACVVYGNSGIGATGSDGQFWLFSTPAGGVTVSALGLLGGNADALLGDVTVFGVTQSVSFGTVFPRSH